MKLINHQEKKTPMLMIIPMIDIIFFLLVFFMMSMLTMVVQKTMPLHLPAASSSSIDTEKTLPIAVDARGQVFLEDTPVTLEMLAEKLAVEKAQNEKLIIVLRGDRVADYGRVVEVMDTVKSVGIDRLSIATEGKKPKSETESTENAATPTDRGSRS